MKHPLWLLAILGVVSLGMRFTVSPPEPEPPPLHPTPLQVPHSNKPANDLDYLLGANSPTPAARKGPKPGTQTVHCYFGEPEPKYTKIGPYRTSKELRDELDHPELWVRNILVAPVQRNGKPFGLKITFKTPTPLARVGLQSGDIILSLNDIPLNQVEACPALLCELRSTSTLSFLVERKGVIVPLSIELL